MLGPARYIHDTKLTANKPGVVTGLAYTPAGGEVLHIEATRYPGKGNVTLTGQIGNVMKESMQAALSLVRSRDGQIGGGAPEDFRDMDIHVHVPAGAVPKDGPSAGVAMFTALASLFSNTPVRSDVAMTGEITLRGLVLPIGGLKEKSLAAMRAGITTDHSEAERKRSGRHSRGGETETAIRARRDRRRSPEDGARTAALALRGLIRILPFLLAQSRRAAKHLPGAQA